MKYLLLFIPLLIVSCEEKTSEHGDGRDSTAHYCCELAENSNIWTSCYDSTGDYVVRGGNYDSKRGGYPEVIAAINKHYPLPGLTFQRKVADTIFVSIDSSSYFTQQMGSAGPIEFKAIVVYSLTESKEFSSVYFDFTEGDHGGMPAAFGREDFDRFYLPLECR